MESDHCSQMGPPVIDHDTLYIHLTAFGWPDTLVVLCEKTFLPKYKTFLRIRAAFVAYE